MNEPIPATKSIVRRVYRSPVLWVFFATLTVLVIHPIPECSDCEFPHPWGRNDDAYHHAGNILTVWFVTATITAGFCSVRNTGLCPSQALSPGDNPTARGRCSVVRLEQRRPRNCDLSWVMGAGGFCSGCDWGMVSHPIEGAPLKRGTESGKERSCQLL